MKVNRKIIVGFMHILGWAIILVIPKYMMPQVSMKVSLIRELSTWLPVIFVFYLNYNVFIPRILTRRRFALYSLALVLAVSVSLLATKAFDHFYVKSNPAAHAFENRPGEKHLLGPFPETGNDSMATVNKVPPTAAMRRDDRFAPPPADGWNMRMRRKGLDMFVLLVLSIAVSTSIKITGKWYSNEKERKEMENQKLITELSFLKSQMNPHFFFNTLNSIYSLAIQKSEKTPEAIVKLSELMRYIIYEADKNLVPLKKELEYIRNYVELQRLRLMSNITVTYTIDGAYHDIMIEPLLFLPFIENAFKHGIDSTKKCEIKIKFVISSNQLIFTVGNPIVRQIGGQTSESSGIGIANTKKRLALLYQERHKLNIEQDNDYFKVELLIYMKENELHYS